LEAQATLETDQSSLADSTCTLMLSSASSEASLEGSQAAEELKSRLAEAEKLALKANEEVSALKSDNERLRGEGEEAESRLQAQLAALREEKARLREELDALKGREEDDGQMKRLLTIKERYGELRGENERLERSLRRLEGEVGELSQANAVATACSVLPLAALVVAVIVAFLPALSSVFGTADGDSG